MPLLRLGGRTLVIAVSLALCGSVPALAAAPGTLSDQRVCGYEAFSKARGTCIRDAGTGPIVSNHLYCSVALRVRARGILQEKLSYRGKTVSQFTEKVAPGAWTFWLVNDLATAQPGGRWRCAFSFGTARAVRDFRSGGPTGPVVGAAVCAGAHAVVVASARMCAADESGTTIAPGREVVCSGVFPDAAGQPVEIQLLSDGQDVKQPWVAKLPGPVWQESGYFSGPLTAGSYVCRISLAGRIVADRAFTVSG